MTDLQRKIASFHAFLMLRIAVYSALMGLLVALVIVIAAPWLRDAAGLPGYWLTLALPVLFPAAYVLYVMLRRPDERTVVLAADAWCGAQGSVVSAYELEREHPDSPFVQPVSAKAIERLDRRSLPEPRLARKLLITLAVMLALVPLSRFVHAEMQNQKEEEKAEELARKVDVPPEEAAKIAQDAGAAAELAKEVGAKEQEKLADDIEQAARNAQAGGAEKERALRDANSLVDRASAPNEATTRRDSARDALKSNETTRELGEAIDNVDTLATREAINELSESVYNEDGTLNPAAAQELREALEEARKQAPNDARLRRAAEAAENLLNDSAMQSAERREKQAREQMEREGLPPEAIEAALKKLQEVDKRALERALEEFSKSSSPLRDLDLNARELEEMLKNIDLGKLDPEQAKALAETARDLGERLELDAEALRELLKQGQDFEGLEELAKRMAENYDQDAPENADQLPEWARDAVPAEMLEAWEKAARESGRPSREGSGRDGQAPGRDGSGGTGERTDTGKTNPEIGEGKTEGVDSKDTGQGEKDPDKDPERLDPNKAGDETAKRDTTGREGDSSGINTRTDEERLPRRYRDAARKYFER